MKKIVLFVLLLGFAGCGFVFQNFDEGERKDLTYGMTKEEVLRKIGAPQKKSTAVIDNKEYEVWEYPNNFSGKASTVNALGTIYSKVFFLNGTVVQRDKDRVYAQPSYEYLESIHPESGVASTNSTRKNNLQ